jgi:hypothetical protein
VNVGMGKDRTEDPEGTEGLVCWRVGSGDDKPIQGLMAVFGDPPSDVEWPPGATNRSTNTFRALRASPSPFLASSSTRSRLVAFVL